MYCKIEIICVSAVCSFPYIIAFTTDTMEIRLIINGNLVQTMAMPKLKLICSKVSSNRLHIFLFLIKFHVTEIDFSNLLLIIILNFFST